MPPQPSKQCVRRLQKELRTIIKEEEALRAEAEKGSGDDGGSGDLAGSTRAALIAARPDPDDILVWYYLVAGPAATPYEGGRYLGTVRFPPDYPFQPPAIEMLTPSGRFTPGSPICMSNSSYHPENWSPLWSVQTILLGLVSFMTEDQVGAAGIVVDAAERRRLAANSRRHNTTVLATSYRKALPDQFAEDVAFLETADKEQRERGDAPSTPADDGERQPALPPFFNPSRWPRRALSYILTILALLSVLAIYL